MAAAAQPAPSCPAGTLLVPRAGGRARERCGAWAGAAGRARLRGPGIAPGEAGGGAPPGAGSFPLLSWSGSMIFQIDSLIGSDMLMLTI